MTPKELRAICDKLNEQREAGGQTRLAGLLLRDGSAVPRKLSEKSPITQSDEQAIEGALGRAEA